MGSHHVGAAGMAAALALTGVSGALAGDTPVDGSGPRLQAVPGIIWEVGTRTWYSTGRIQNDLFDTTGALLVSRLTYDNLTGVSAEGYFRADHRSGVFAKGTIGGGSVIGGKMNDEDFPPVTVPYSNTLQRHKDGDLTYGSIDLGYTFWDRGGFSQGGEAVAGQGRLGAFLGYHQWRERLNTYGCTNVSGGVICDPAIPTTQNTLDNEAIWRSLRLGVVGDTRLGPRVKVTGEVAYVRSWLDGTDFHNLRPDILPLKENGTGDGVQAEVIVSYQVSEALSLGLGARWWRLSTSDGLAHFEDTPGGGSAQVIKFETGRYGVFLQGSYKLADADRTPGSIKDDPVSRPYVWSGSYAGLNSGYGWGAAKPGIGADSANAAISLTIGDVPSGMSYDTAGYVSGGLAGYNARLGPMLVGVEADLSLAHIAGTGSITSTVTPFNTTIDQRVDWFGTLRGRIGTFPAHNLMLFASGGLAYGETKLNAAVVGPVGTACAVAATCSISSANGISIGWAVGAGLEYALASNLTFKGEYLYVDLGDRSVHTQETATGGLLPFSYTARSDFNFHVLRSGVNYKF
jgi:opacity protein-like surface antigen